MGATTGRKASDGEDGGSGGRNLAHGKAAGEDEHEVMWRPTLAHSQFHRGEPLGHMHEALLMMLYQRQ